MTIACPVSISNKQIRHSSNLAAIVDDENKCCCSIIFACSSIDGAGFDLTKIK
jgi:hypothetical protein